MRVTGLDDRPYELRQWRVDAVGSNVAARWHDLGGGADWPDEEQRRTLAEADRLDEAAPPRHVDSAGGVVDVEVHLPMPGSSTWS